jgi:hypothetical protein
MKGIGRRRRTFTPGATNDHEQMPVVPVAPPRSEEWQTPQRRVVVPAVPGGAESPNDDATPATAERTAAQTISFADDAAPEPATQIQGAPKRPPLPRFRLFGTRESDGPN